MIMKSHFDYASPCRGRRVPLSAWSLPSPPATEVNGTGWYAVKFGGQSRARPRTGLASDYHPLLWSGATMSTVPAFQPETLITGVAPCRSAELYVTVRVCDSPGNSVTSLSRQVED